MTHTNTPPKSNPRPFIPEPHPTTDDYFLCFEFTPTNPDITLTPKNATNSNTRYLTNDGRVIFKSAANYDAVEIAPTYVRYTVSVPTPSFATLDDYLTEAHSKLQPTLPAPLGECTLRIFLIGESVFDSSNTGIVHWLKTARNATTVTLHSTHKNGGVAIYTPHNADTHQLQTTPQP